jgi:aminobenzoyl-glutamate utilization protein A
MVERVNEICDEIAPGLIAYRRDFHKYAESGWNEYRTASIIAKRLKDLGYELKVGPEIIDPDSRMGLPGEDAQREQYRRALSQGAVEEYAEKMANCFTAVIGVLSNGEGPTTAFRFDIDALELTESGDPEHFPNKEGFASINQGVMHACGHDGHATIGLGVAEVLSRLRESLRGTVKLIFQPAEEGVRGAKSIAASGILDDVDVLYGLHIGFKARTSGELYCGSTGFLATSKFDAVFRGSPAHAGAAPQEGRNALLAAASAIMNLFAIPRHGDGATRINVGTLVGGSGRNIIPDYARMTIETRGETSELNEYMKAYARRVLESSARAHETDLEVTEMGDAEGGESDQALVAKIQEIADSMGAFTTVHEEVASLGGSEDFTHLMRRVQSRGGKATYMMLGTDLKDSHHNSRFDFAEKDLINGVKLLSLAALT